MRRSLNRREPTVLFIMTSISHTTDATAAAATTDEISTLLERIEIADKPLVRRMPKAAQDPPTKMTPELKLKLSEFFAKATKGYHSVNDDPIKESRWEAINAQVLQAAGCHVSSMSSGSHAPGSDITCSLGKFSNKSAKYNALQTKTAISSYRLTTVCSDKDHGTMEKIVEEIQSRKNFNYYSVLIYTESETELLYDWYLIPADHPAIDPTTYNWKPKVGKRGTKKGDVVGWETDAHEGSSMDITFSMSSQLWIHLTITPDLRSHLVASSTVTKGLKCNYITLHDMLQDLEK